MSLQWTCIAGFLYGEMIVVFLLTLPFISPRLWSSVFKSRFLKSFAAQSNLFFMVTIAVLVLFFIDSIREMLKYSHLRDIEVDHMHIHSEQHHSMKMFRAQRNFYIAGFALFLWLVIRRLVTLITCQANLMAQTEAAVKQAQNASHAASEALESRTVGDVNNENALKELRKQLQEKEKELSHALKDRDAMKTQAENLAKQYDELCNEHQKTAARRSSKSD